MTDGEKPKKRRVMVYFWPDEYARLKAVSSDKKISMSMFLRDFGDAAAKRYIARHKLDVAYGDEESKDEDAVD